MQLLIEGFAERLNEYQDSGYLREELRAGLEQLWKASLAERARLAERSVVLVLDGC